MKSLFSKLLILLPLTLIAIQCTNTSQKNRLKAYYYPYKDMKEGVIYEYLPLQNKTHSTIYWYLQSRQKEGKWYMDELYLEDDHLPQQSLKEKIVSNGVLAQEIHLFLQDTSGQIIEVDGDILSGNVFSFESKKFEGVLLSKNSFKFPDGTQNTTTVIKNRQYEGDTTINILSNKYQTARFRVKEIVSMGNDQDGYTEPELSGVEHYGKGVGLVYFKKESEGNTIFEYGLNKKYPLKEAPTPLRQAIESFLRKNNE